MSHSNVVGGSSCGRLIQCPGSRKLSETMPKFEGNKYTEQGTALHYACEEMLRDDDKSPKDFIGEVYDIGMGYEITEADVVGKLVPAWNAWEEFSKAEDIDVYAEECVVHFQDPALKGVFGTADIIARSADGKVAYGVDWKFGHKPVDPEENDQGLFYAAAGRQDPETADLFEGVEEVCIAIIQPEVDDEAQYWFTTLERLDLFVEELTNALEWSEQDDAPLKEGKHCTFCPAMAACPLKKKLVDQVTDVQVTPINLVDILNVADDVEKVIKAARSMAHDMLDAGQNVPGWKLVEKQSRRQYTDIDAVETLCKNAKKIKAEDYYDYKLKSPAQLEKVCKAKGLDFKRFSDNIASVSSGSKLARDGDKRETKVVAASVEIPEGLAKRMTAQ